MTGAIALAVLYVVVLAVVNMQVVEYLKKPIAMRFPKLNLWFVTYISFATGCALAFGFGLDVFEFMPPHSIYLGMFLTGCLVGGGSSLIFNVVSGIVKTVTRLKDVLADLATILKDLRQYVDAPKLVPPGG